MNRKFASYAAGLLVSTSLATPVIAQDEDDSAAEVAAVDDNVIIVTATRRAEDVQDIPIAVTAVSPEQLNKQGVVNVQNITTVSPSFSTSNAQTVSGSVVLRIRGVGTTSNNIGFESAVGIFVDGAYQSRPGVALSEFVDVERVEVLRGPQGTLFGRNTSAGALNITNKRPDVTEFGGFANATYGNYDLMNVQGAVNVPLVQDTLALRVTGAYRERDGYIDVIDAAGNSLGESNSIDQHLLRGQLGYEGDSGIRARLIVDYTKSSADCCSPVELLASGLEGAPFAAVGLGARGGMAHDVPATSPFDQSGAEDALANLTATADFLPLTDVKQWGITGEIEIPLGDNADIIYIGSYRDYDAFENYDSDFSGIDWFNVVNNTAIKTMTHELRVQGEAWDGRLNWLVGGYYADEEIQQVVDFSSGPDYGRFVGALALATTSINVPALAPFGGAFGAATNVTNAMTPTGFQTPLDFVTGVPGAGNTVAVANQYIQDSKSWSLFTHNDIEIADGLTLTLGARYSDESKDGSFDQLQAVNDACAGFLTNGSANLQALVGNLVGSGRLALADVDSLLNGRLLPNGERATFGLSTIAFLGSCFPFFAPADTPASAVLPLPRTFESTFNDSELIYTVKLGYEFAAPVNVYASFTHGYKSGGFNLDNTAAVGGADPRFASEEVDAYEIGMKARLLDNAVTLNAALFHEEFTNFQVLEFTGAQFITFNVPSAKTSGVEIESVIRPNDNFTFNLGYTYTDARYPSDCAGDLTSVTVLALCGNSLTNAPKHVVITGMNYERYIGNDLLMFLSAQARTTSDARTSTQAIVVPSLVANIPTAAPLPFDVQDGYTKVNLRAGIGAEDESWQIEVWGVNVTDQVTRGVTFGTTLRSGSRSAFPQEPRTYGVTFRTKF